MSLFSVELGDEEIEDTFESPVSDGTIEENFEEALGAVSLLPEAADTSEQLMVENFSDIAQYGIVDVIGDDIYGRKVIVVSACRLPSNKVLDHNRLLRLVFFFKYIFCVADQLKNDLMTPKIG